MKLDYNTYIRSDEWRTKHRFFLQGSNYQCSMFFWIRCGKGRPYRVHHKTYDNLGDEVLWEDVIILCPFAHDFIIHGILSGFKSAGKQKGGYPNKAQKIAHVWCCLPVGLKLCAIGLVVGLISYLVTGSAAR